MGWRKFSYSDEAIFSMKIAERRKNYNAIELDKRLKYRNALNRSIKYQRSNYRVSNLDHDQLIIGK